MKELSHIDDKGNASMVDVGEKSNTKRVAIATGAVSMRNETLELILSGKK
jgi:cyclic pyranopterin phosphate synthase